MLTQGTAEEYPPPKGIKAVARTIKPPRLAFAGNYSVRGCYQHTRGLLRGVAFFSLGSCDLDSSTQEEVRTSPTAVRSDDCLTSSRDSSCFERATRCAPGTYSRCQFWSVTEHDTQSPWRFADCVREAAARPPGILDRGLLGGGRGLCRRPQQGRLRSRLQPARPHRHPLMLVLPRLVQNLPSCGSVE